MRKTKKNHLRNKIKGDFKNKKLKLKQINSTHKKNIVMVPIKNKSLVNRKMNEKILQHEIVAGILKLR